MQTKTQTEYLEASTTPLADIGMISYAGQPAHMRMYRPGYEHFMNMMPVLDDDSPSLSQDVARTNEVMNELGKQIKIDGWLPETNVRRNGFKRTIVAMVTPLLLPYSVQARSELVVAHWGDKFSSPVHGHTTGYLYEAILSGMMRVMTYQISDIENKIVRPFSVEIAKEGVFVNKFAPANPLHKYKRQTLIHNFQSIGESHSLHYLPEHTRDGKDNTFEVENWADSYELTSSDVKRVTSKEAYHLPIGSVLLVRSQNVPEYGDHYIIITGHPVMKEHGLRPQDHAIPALSYEDRLLDGYEMEMGLILLKLDVAATKNFLQFHNVQIVNNKVILPEL